MKFHIHTYGCQMNARDSESVAAVLSAAGYTEADNEAESDLVIVNTCSVRAKAEDKAVGKLGLLVHSLKKNNPGAIVGAMGCMVQRKGMSIFDEIKGLDFAVGTRSLPLLEKVVEDVLNGGSRIAVLDEVRHGVVAAHRAGPISAFVNILMGCDRGCSYCIVPRVRGREWSRPAREIISEVRDLVQKGVKEITFLGQSVMSYGLKNEIRERGETSCRGFKEPLPMLLEAANAVDGLERIRFTSGHPLGCTDEMSRAVAELEKVCEHMHVAVQSGSDRILKSMGRGYTADEYAAAIQRMRNRSANLTLTTDIIVGYPGETADEFEMTRKLMDDMEFDNAFIFKYSPRPGTRAAELDDDVSDEEKARRNAVLLEDQDRRGRMINKGYIGRDVEVLCEGVSLRNKNRLAGRTRGNKIVVFDRVDGIVSGDKVTVAVDRAGPQTLYGQVKVIK